MTQRGDTLDPELGEAKASAYSGTRVPEQRGALESRFRSQSYQWPVDMTVGVTRTDPSEAGDASTYAELNVGTGHEPDGTMTTWQYRVALENADAMPLTDPGTDAAAVPLLIYRYVNASIAMDASSAHVIPAHAHAFARESFIDELAHELHRDPVELRMQHLDAQLDDGAREVIRMVAERATWGSEAAVAIEPASPWIRGRGFAFDGESREPLHSSPNDSACLPVSAIGGGPDRHADSWTAWVVDVDVNRDTGDVAVRRVVAGRGAGKPGEAFASGLPSQRVVQAIERSTGVLFLARPAHDETGLTNDGAAISHELTLSGVASSESPALVSRELTPQESADVERAAAPAAAAIANAVFDATGVRFRSPRLDAQLIRRAMAEAVPATLANAPAVARRPSRWRRWMAGGGIGGAIGGLIGLACAMLPGPASIAPVSSVDTSLWSAATLERGRQIAAAGDCAVCHTAPDGQTNAGGLALETPFGTVYSTNLTPDRETGIGAWSYEAFARAMRKGIARDGSHLYPAFPYTAFTKMSESDIMALYAYLMSQPAVKNSPPKTKLPFPMSVRPLVAGWNWLFLDNRAFLPDETRSAQWNRGKYLVDGAGHCGACHTPRNVIGAEKGGFAYLTGGSAEGWDAPSLIASRVAPIPWTEAALFDYLRTGFSVEHGVAAGPMAPVVHGLSTLPESDVRAIAHYITSLSPPVDSMQSARAAAAQMDGGRVTLTLGLESGRRMFESACAVCHAESGGVGHFGVRPLMGLNTSVAQAVPDNLLHVLQYGIDHPATADLGYMPGFKDVFDDRQMAELATYIRARYAPNQPAWRNLEAASARVRAQSH